MLALLGAETMAAILARLISASGVAVPLSDGTLFVDLSYLVFLVPLIRRGAKPADFGLRRVPGARSVGIVVLGLFAYIYGAHLWSGAVNVGPSRSNFSGLPHASAVVVVLSGFAAIVSAPVMEEVFWRGMLYSSLRNKLGVLPGCVIAAALFGAIHFQYPWSGRAEVAMFGVIATLLYQYTGSLLPGIALHSLIDGSGFESGLTGHVGIVLGGYLLLALVLVSRDVVRRVAGRRILSAPAD